MTSSPEQSLDGTEAEANSRTPAPRGPLAAPLNVSRSDLRWVAVLGTTFSAVAVTIVFFRSRYYIELADQSLYLLMIDEPRASIRSASGYHVLLAPLFDLVGASPIRFRWLRAVLDISADLILGLSLVRYLRWRSQTALFASTTAAVAVVSSVVLAGMAVWIYAVNGFGYDQLGGIVFTLWAALLLLLVGKPVSTQHTSWLATASGAVLLLGAIVRWTAATVVTGLLVWILTERFGWTRSRKLLGHALVGAVSCTLFVHFFIFDVPVLVNGIRSGTVDVSRDTHALPVLVGRGIDSLVRGIFGGVAIAIGVVAVYGVLATKRATPVVLLFGAIGTGAFVFTAQDWLGSTHSEEANTVGTLLALVSGLVWLAHARDLYQHRSRPQHTSQIELAAPAGRNLGLLATFISLPVLLAAGSFIPIFLTALPLAGLWVVALWVMLPEVSSVRLRNVGSLTLVVILSTMPWLVWQGFATPARTLTAETPVEVDRGRYEGLLVDEATQRLLHDLEDLRVELDPNPTVLSLWARPAVPFALEGTGLGFPWYKPSAPNAAAETLSGACLDDGDIPTGDVVIVTQERELSEFAVIRDALLDCGIDFPAQFELVSRTEAPIDVELFVYLREANS